MTSEQARSLPETPPAQFWKEVFAAADRALELEPAERQTFLERFLEHHPAVGAELIALIAAAGTASALEIPASMFAGPFLWDAMESGEGASGSDRSRFGPYTVRREIGRGGMGAVYLAERTDDQYRKEVALKVLPPWSGGGEGRRRRFIEERQILAALDHPGIARLLDGGVTAEGLPWFAMEYIDGESIDRYCDGLRLSIEERLALFCEVCAAVQYAHRNLVVHRDLKPSNILVSAHGRVALLDFGIARLLTEHRGTMAVSMATGDTVLTPLYASPEQIRGEPASTAADVYALGVVLHVLLTGRYPYRLASLNSYEVTRAVLEQEPVRPSLSASAVGARSIGAAQASVEDRALERGSTPAKLTRRLRGDLDAIVLKAMEKDPGRRYATAEQLETDVRRHLTRLPVLARPASRLYVTRKFLRRHRVGVGIATAASFLVLSFTTVMTVQRSHIRAQAVRITVERDRAEQVGRFFLNTFQSIAPGDRGIAARDILDSATARIDEQFSAHPAQRARLMFEMARAYHRIEMHDRAGSLLERSLALRRNLRPSMNLDVAETQALLGAVRLAQRRVEPAAQAYAEAVALRRQELGSTHRDVARSLVGLSAALRAQRRLPEAERISREAMAIDRSRRGDVPADLAQSTGALAHVLSDKGEHHAAVGLFREALTIQREAHPEDHPEVAGAVFDLASALYGAGDRHAADSLIQYGLGLQRRLLTAALLRGGGQVHVADGVSLPSSPPASETLSGEVERAFAQPPPEAPMPAVAVANRSRIAFASDRDGPDPIGDRGNQEIYVMNADGTDLRRLTRENAQDFGPAWSPDGSMIAFTSQRGGGFDIFVMNADGTAQRQLTRFTERGLGAVEPAWSPDGERIAFRTRVGEIAIHVINVDGSGVAKVASDAAPASTPSWSPDGRRIVFSSRRHGAPEIFVMDSDGGNLLRLTTNDAVDHRPAWSPDGRRIAFHSDRDGNQEIYVMNADGTNQTRLTRNPGEDAHPSWSPDGRRIVFHRQVLGHLQIHVMNADGSDVQRLTELSTVAFSGFPSWGPGRR